MCKYARILAHREYVHSMHVGQHADVLGARARSRALSAAWGLARARSSVRSCAASAAWGRVCICIHRLTGVIKTHGSLKMYMVKSKK